MFKNCFNWITIIILSLSFFACAKQKDSSGKSLTSEEEKAVEFVNSHLDKGFSLVDFQVVKNHLPYQLWLDLSLVQRRLFDEKWDYKRAMELSDDNPRKEERLQFHKQWIEKYQSDIIEKIDVAKKDKKGERTFILVLATLEKDDGIESNRFKIITAFNSETGEKVLWEKVPRTNAILTTVASAGDIFNYETNEDYNLDSLIQTVSDPVLKFILEPVKE